jgi:hypothetical protein
MRAMAEFGLGLRAVLPLLYPGAGALRERLRDCNALRIASQCVGVPVMRWRVLRLVLLLLLAAFGYLLVQRQLLLFGPPP